jgi:hypothetical protein
MTTLHVGDYGATLEMTIEEDDAAVDISGATTIQIKLKAPDGRLLNKTATLSSDGSDGKMNYTLQQGDLSVPGKWRWQGYLAGVGGWTGHTSEGQPFDVKQVVG